MADFVDETPSTNQWEDLAEFLLSKDKTGTKVFSLKRLNEPLRNKSIVGVMFLKANFAPAIIHQEQKQLYYTYLYKAQTKDDHSQLESFLCDAVVDGFKILERVD